MKYRKNLHNISITLFYARKFYMWLITMVYTRDPEKGPIKTITSYQSNLLELLK